MATEIPRNVEVNISPFSFHTQTCHHLLTIHAAVVWLTFLPLDEYRVRVHFVDKTERWSQGWLTQSCPTPKHAVGIVLSIFSVYRHVLAENRESR